MSAIGTQGIYPVRDGVIRKQRRVRGVAIFLLILLGLVLETGYLALYPWLAGRLIEPSDSLRQSWEELFPWLAASYQRLNWPTEIALLPKIAWPSLLYGHLYPLLGILACLLLVLWLAVQVGNWAGHIMLLRSAFSLRPVFWTILSIATLLALTMVLAPVHLSELSRAMLTSSFYGRMVETYYLNPYIAHVTVLAHDPIALLLAKLPDSKAASAATVGPVWMDISILISWVSAGNPARMVLAWRVLALAVHLLNIALIWSLLSIQKPVQRIAGTLLYAWNPLVLLLGIAMVHSEILLISLLLLALLSLQRDATLLSWVFALLAVLVNPVCLIVLPLFLIFSLRRVSLIGCGWLFLWGIGTLGVTAIVLFLGYIPYWQGWGAAGLLSSIREIFWQGIAINSLDAAALAMPVHLPASIAHFFQPPIWETGVLSLLALYLCFALWLADTFELVLQSCGWLFLLWVILQPIYWPWYLLVPIVIVFCTSNRSQMVGAHLLILGALISYYFWQWPQGWSGQGLAVIGVPFLIWGWGLFFHSTWQMAHKRQEGSVEEESRPQKLQRPPWFSRPWTSHPTRAHH